MAWPEKEKGTCTSRCLEKRACVFELRWRKEGNDVLVVPTIPWWKICVSIRPPLGCVGCTICNHYATHFMGHKISWRRVVAWWPIWNQFARSCLTRSIAKSKSNHCGHTKTKSTILQVQNMRYTNQLSLQCDEYRHVRMCMHMSYNVLRIGVCECAHVCLFSLSFAGTSLTEALLKRASFWSLWRCHHISSPRYDRLESEQHSSYWLLFKMNCNVGIQHD